LNIQNENLTESLKTQTINIHGLLTQKIIEAPGAKKTLVAFLVNSFFLFVNIY